MINLERNASNADLARAYEAYIGMVRVRVADILGADDAVEDAAQDAFAQFIAVTKRSEVQNVQGLLFHIATCTALRRLQRRNRWRKWLAHEQLIAIVENGVEKDETRIMLNKVLLKVDPELAAIATYFCIDDIPRIEVASMMGMPERTLSRRLEAFTRQALELLSKDGSSAAKEGAV